MEHGWKISSLRQGEAQFGGYLDVSSKMWVLSMRTASDTVTSHEKDLG